MKLLSNTVGKKILMAVTGQILILFIIAHVIGNSTIYFSGLNAYAEHLYALAALVWANRFVKQRPAKNLCMWRVAGRCSGQS